MSGLLLIDPNSLTHTASYPQDIALVPSAVTVTQLTYVVINGSEQTTWTCGSLFLISPTLNHSVNSHCIVSTGYCLGAVSRSLWHSWQCRHAQWQNMTTWKNVRKSSVSCHNATPPETQNYAVQSHLVISISICTTYNQKNIQYQGVGEQSLMVWRVGWISLAHRAISHSW